MNGFESVQCSVQSVLAGITLAQPVFAANELLHSSDIISLAACSTAEKGFQNRINLFRPDV